MTFQGATINLAKFLSEWLISVQSSLRPDTLHQYNQIIRDHNVPTLGKIKLMDFRPNQAQELYNRKLKDGIGTRTVQLTHSVLHCELNHGVKLGLPSRNPTDATNPPKPQYKEMLILDENQAQLLIISAESNNDRYAVLYHLAITTGMRQSELLGLKWQDLDWGRRTLQVHRQLKRRKGGGYYFPQPKTKSGKRTIALGNHTVEKLCQHYERLLIMRQLAEKNWHEIDLIFPSTVEPPLIRVT